VCRSGVSKKGEVGGEGETVLGALKPSHLQSIRKAGPVIEEIEETVWIAGPSWAVPVQTTGGEVPLTFIDPDPVYPPEAVY
jgi:hypothetical protein